MIIAVLKKIAGFISEVIGCFREGVPEHTEMITFVYDL